MSTLKLFLASLFAYAGILAGRIAAPKSRSWCESAPDMAIQAGEEFVKSWSGKSSRQSSRKPPPVERAERPDPPPAAPPSVSVPIRMKSWKAATRRGRDQGF